MSQTEAQELKIYEITHRATGETSFQAASSAEDACKKRGWPIGDCYVNPQKPRRSLDADTPSQLVVKIPCRTCPFQYGECRKPETEDCPTRPSAPELQNWLKQAAQAHLCQYVGVELSKTDYHLGQKWLPMEKAIEELGDYR